MRLAYLTRLEETRARIPASAHETPLAAIGLSDRVLNLLTEAGYQNAAQTMEQVAMDEDKILALEGFGPKAMEELRAVIDAYVFPIPVAPAEAEVEAPVAEPAVEIPVEAGVEAAEAAVPAAEAGLAMAPPEAEAAVAVEGVEAVATPADSLEKAFEAIAQEIGAVVEATGGEAQEEEEDEKGAAKADVKKKKKKGARTVEFDPELGGMVVKRRRKPGRGGGWEEGV